MTNTNRITEDLMNSENERLSQKNLGEIAENFRKAYSTLLVNNKNKPFLNWLLLQAPINLLPCSTTSTALAATDGNIYINPVFWSAIVACHENTPGEDVLEKQKKKLADLNYLIVHEVGHLMLRHPWSVKRTIMETAQENQIQDPKQFQYIANMCVDFVVNAGFCNQLLPDADVLRNNGISSNESFRNFLQKNVGELSPNIEEMFKEPDLPLWGWDDIYHVIVNNLTKEQLEKMQKASQDKSQGLCGSGGFGGGGSGGDNAATGTHGEKVDTGTAERIREKGVSSGDLSNPEAKWRKIAAEAVAEARSMGTGAGNIARLFESDFEVRVPWETLIRERLASSLGNSQVRQTWMRSSRKHDSFPGNLRIGGKNLWLLADVSGSMSDKELDAMAGISLSFLKRTGGTLRVVFWDTEVCGDNIVRTRSDLKRVSSNGGGGGTVILPALQHLLNNGKKGDNVCVCTDSAIADISNKDTELALKEVCARYGNIIWFHFGSKRELNDVMNISGGKIAPVVINTQSRLVDRLMPKQAGQRLV
jgi:hypothetical protein